MIQHGSHGQNGQVNLLQRLRAETALAHARIEQAFDLDARMSSVCSYRNLLARLYGFHAAWEPSATTALPDPELLCGRLRTPFLIADLQALGMTDAEIDQLALCDCNVVLSSPAQALGSMYVVEGSTLGGTFIARHVERRLGLGSDSGCSYFRCYGSAVGPMWKAFGARLLALCGSYDEDVVVASANQTFDVLRAWLCSALRSLE